VTEATYTYFASGKPKRLQLGTAQGVDYRYNERDWLVQINHQNLGGICQGQPQDPGRDGYDSGLPVDRFGEVIGYNLAQHIGDPSNQNATPQWNGNISWSMYNMYNVNSLVAPSVVMLHFLQQRKAASTNFLRSKHRLQVLQSILRWSFRIRIFLEQRLRLQAGEVFFLFGQRVFFSFFVSFPNSAWEGKAMKLRFRITDNESWAAVDKTYTTRALRISALFRSSARGG
jgi:hypothetical protein